MVGFEPTTVGLTGRCSNHCSYIPIFVGEEGFEPTYPKPVRHL